MTKQYSTALPPNPGSEAAQSQGCTCPVTENRHGKGIRDGRNEFWIACQCPLHGLHAEGRG
jgi:hypothetical protein